MAAQPACPHGLACCETGLLHFADFSHPDAEEIDNDKAGLLTEAVSCACQDHDRAEETNSDGGKPSLKRQDTVPIDDSSLIEAKRLKCDEDKNGIDDCQSSRGLSRGLSLLRQYSAMSHSQRKAIIAEALAARRSLEERLARAESRERRLLSTGCLGLPPLPGELEAISQGHYLTVSLLAPDLSRYCPGSAEESHYRLAESQFHRLLARDCVGCFQVTKVDYIINPELLAGFRQFHDEHTLKDKGDQLSCNTHHNSSPVLAFHGTEEANIDSICRFGFRTPEDGANYKQGSDSGWYGRGVYFSEYPACAMDYVKGRSKLLLCLVNPGRTYHCQSYSHGQPCQPGYQSHRSPDLRELVIFDPRQALPAYAVHYEHAAPSKPDLKIEAKGPYDDLHLMYFDASKTEDTTYRSSSRILRGKNVRILKTGFGSAGLLLTRDQVARFCLDVGADSVVNYEDVEDSDTSISYLTIILDDSYLPKLSEGASAANNGEVWTLKELFQKALHAIEINCQ